MRTYTAEYSTVIDASPQAVIAVLSDYEDAHKQILPKPYFADMTVLEGGQGAGTKIRVDMDVYGVQRTFNLLVTEPEPGRRLVETDEVEGVETTFAVDPVNGGRQSNVKISAVFRQAPGFMGFMERLTTPGISRRIYKKELVLLADYLRTTVPQPRSA
ncbi:MAG: SRPBCC family protein [Chloroflexota bacterium]